MPNYVIMRSPSFVRVLGVATLGFLFAFGSSSASSSTAVPPAETTTSAATTATTVAEVTTTAWATTKTTSAPGVAPVVTTAAPSGITTHANNGSGSANLTNTVWCTSGIISMTATTAAPVTSSNSTTNSTSRMNTNSSGISTCRSNTGTCYVLYDSDTTVVTLGCTSVFSPPKTCASEYAANAADKRCEFCCMSSLCNANYGKQKVGQICNTMLLPSGAVRKMTVSAQHHLVGIAIAILVAVSGFGGSHL